jgi:hypothetical protein
MRKVEAQLKELSELLKFCKNINKTVSEVSVGWHIEHSLLVIKQITATVAQSDPKLFKSKFNFNRFWVFLLGYIPRGKAKAPRVVIPSEDLTLELLEESINQTHQALAYLKDCEANQYFMHPFFGALNRDQTIKFLFIHTKHHLKIIKDIIASNGN